MCVVQASGGARDHGQRELERDARALAPCPREQSAQILAMDVLHGQEVDAGVLADLEHLSDVLVVQRRGEPGLVEEHLNGRLIVLALRQDHLQHHVAFEAADARGAADVDPRHPTRGERREDLVLPETGG